jgi:hypothetical protein
MLRSGCAASLASCSSHEHEACSSLSSRSLASLIAAFHIATADDFRSHIEQTTNVAAITSIATFVATTNAANAAAIVAAVAAVTASATASAAVAEDAADAPHTAWTAAGIAAATDASALTPTITTIHAVLAYFAASAAIATCFDLQFWNIASRRAMDNWTHWPQQ